MRKQKLFQIVLNHNEIKNKRIIPKKGRKRLKNKVNGKKKERTKGEKIKKKTKERKKDNKT